MPLGTPWAWEGQQQQQQQSQQHGDQDRGTGPVLFSPRGPPSRRLPVAPAFLSLSTEFTSLKPSDPISLTSKLPFPSVVPHLVLNSRSPQGNGAEGLYRGQMGEVHRRRLGLREGTGQWAQPSPLKFRHPALRPQGPLPSKEPLFLRLHQRGLDSPEALAVRLGARQRGADGQGLAQMEGLQGSDGGFPSCLDSLRRSQLCWGR